MKLLKSIFRGVLIGVANIIPGVSGGTMAVSMGIYDKIIYAVTHIKSDFKKSMEILIPILIGALLGLVGLSFVIKWLFSNYPMQTNLLFIGLIVGSLPIITKNLKGTSIRIKEGIVFLIFFGVVVLMPILGSSGGSSVVLHMNPVMVIQMFFVGVIAAATMVIPGVSGSMVLLILGFYQPVLNTITEFTVSLSKMDITGIMRGMYILIPMAIGILIGIIGIAKIIEFLFENYPTITYCGIIGLIVGSPIAILFEAKFTDFSAITIITSVIALIVGCVVAYFLGGDESKEA
ncbi:MAG: DUF368 domain-containing protein [Anaerostipes sp.]|nr:DUF368 domain-containing protein [Anaerostipes sp.]